jgi:hypothetical protein
MKASLSEKSKSIVRHFNPPSRHPPSSGLLSFCALAEATEPNGFIYLAYVGAVVLAYAITSSNILFK